MVEPSEDGTAKRPIVVVGTHSTHVRRFVAGLCAAGQPVVLLTDAAQRLVDHSLVLDQGLVNFSVRSWSTAATIRRYVDRWQPRAVHAHQANSVAWHAARACRGGGTPLVITIWGSDVLVTPTQGILKRRMVQVALRAAALWTADAAELLRAARDVAQVERASAHVVMGVDRICADLREVWAEKLELALSCRWHKPLYRIDAIIAAFCELARRHPAWALEVAASGPETQALTSLASEADGGDAVRFTGMLDAEVLQRSYRRSSVYVSFPTSDGTSVSLLEAMALGCYPVVSDVPANREWIVDGLNGNVVARPEDLAPAIERAMLISRSEHWREQIAPANHRLIREKALFADNIRQFLALYKHLAV
jgi:L-malate glycosyltransferase